jgi:hypothetical protein
MMSAEPADRFLLDGKHPERITVRDVTPDGHATRIYAVVADYGWAETILAGDCYDHTANDLAIAVGTFLDVPFDNIPKEQ